MIQPEEPFHCCEQEETEKGREHPSVQKKDDAYEMERQKRRKHAQYYL